MYPVLPGARFTCPKNYAVPPIIGNRWALNIQEGARQPMVDLSFQVLDDANGVMGLTFLNYFLSRTNDAADDTYVIGNGSLVFFDGYRTVVMNGIKADSFTLSTSRGDNLNLQARFCGSSIDITQGAPTFSGWSRNPLLKFQSVNFTSAPFTNNIWNFNLSYSNNHSPNAALNGSSFPVEMNAGMLSSAFSCMVQTNSNFVDNGMSWNAGGTYTNQEVIYQGGVGTYLSPQSIVFTIQGNNVGTRTFTIPDPVNNTPDDVSITLPRIMRSYSYINTGLNSQGTPPLIIT